MLDFFRPHDLGRQLHMLEPQQEEQVHFLDPLNECFLLSLRVPDCFGAM